MKSKFVYDSPSDIQIFVQKYNPNHDSNGRFASGGASSGPAVKEYSLKNGAKVEMTHKTSVANGNEYATFTQATISKFGEPTETAYLRSELGKVQMIFVPEKYRRQGIGAEMLSFARANSKNEISHSKMLTHDGRAFANIVKYNPNHDANGRFASGGGSSAGAGAPAPAGAGAQIKPADPANGYVTADEATLTEGTFDEKTQGDELAATYEDRYNVDNSGNPIGTTKAEIDALDSYSRNGYKDINAELRGQNVRQDLDVSEAIPIIENDESMYLQAIDQWSENNDKGSMDMTEADLQDAMYLYATSHGKELLDRINTGNTPKALAVKEKVTHLDGLIASAPVAFGDKPLYRVFDNKVLADLKPGDVVTDKGFLSTTRTNVIHEDNSSSRTWLSGIDKTPDTAGIILPNKSKNGKGIAVDAFRTAVGESNPVSADEREVLLPRGVPLLFLGYTDFGVEDRAPVFQRMDG